MVFSNRQNRSDREKISGGGNEEGTSRSFRGAMKLFCILTVVLVTSVHTCVKNFLNYTPKVNFLCHDLKNKIITKDVGCCVMCFSVREYDDMTFFFCSINIVSSIKRFPGVE